MAKRKRKRGAAAGTSRRPPKAKRGQPAKDEVIGGGEQRSSLDRRTGFVTSLAGTPSFGVKRVQYAAVKGIAIFEGDIALGTVEQMERLRAAADATSVMRDAPASGAAVPSSIQFAAAIVGQRYRWPGGVIPYEVQPVVQERVAAAIAAWQEKTRIRFVLRTPQNAATYRNYVSFEEGDGCASAVGMQGGMQKIWLGPLCGVGQAIHEIGHAVGLWHEQSREDRDQFIRIQWENITAGMEFNFDQHITDGDDIGPYDYGSVMHYPGTAFSATGLPTILALGGEAVGQRDGLSDSDVAAVAALYPGAVGAQHLYTSSIIELANTIRDRGYHSDGIVCHAFAVPVPGSVPLFKLSKPQGQQLFTTSIMEAYEAVAQKAYAMDGVACYLYPTPAPGLTALYHLAHHDTEDRLYSTSLAEVYQAVALFGYEGQGIAGYVPSTYVPGTIQLYRLSKAA